MKKDRKVYLEILRIVAIYFVIFNHTNERGFIFFTRTDPGITYWIYMIFAVICGISVPLFYMISGVTLLGKEEGISEVWRKRILRFVIVIIVFSFIQYWVSQNCLFSECVMDYFFRKIYTSSMIIPYWYLYSYLGFLVVLPFIRKLVSGMTEKECTYLLTLSLVFQGILPCVEYRLTAGGRSLNGNFSISVVLSIIVLYPVIGYFADKAELSWKSILKLWIGTVLAVICVCYMTSYKIGLTGDISEGGVGTFFGYFRVLEVLTVFMTVKKICETVTIPDSLKKGITACGSCVFGVYLIEQILREKGYFIYEKMCGGMPDFLAILLYVFLIMVVGLLTTGVLKKLPGFRKLL